jgi:hypothetical protein
MKFRKIILILLMLLLFAACSSFSSPEEQSQNDNTDTSLESEGMAPSFTNDENAITNKDNTAVSGEKLIQNIGLELETKQYAKTVSEIEALVRSLNGYIQSSYVPKPRNDVEFSNLEASLNVMIPTSSIDDFILKTGKTSNLVYERREAYNVTDVYRDTESRINTLKAKELRLLDLLKESGTLSDLLMIENELSNTRYEIERLESSIQDFDTRIKYTQFNITIREVYEFTPSEQASLWERIVEGFTSNAQNFLRTLESVFIFVVTSLPFMLIQFLLWCLPLLFIYLIYRKVTKNKNVFNLFKKNKTSISNQEDKKE